MKVFFKLFIFLILSASLWAGGGIRVGAKPSNPYDRSLTNVSFESVDFTPLRVAAQQIYPSASDAELDQMVQRNVKFIFHNRLNRQRFLVAPDPSLVVTRIVRLFEETRRLDKLLEKGSVLLRKEGPTAAFRPLMRQIGDAADDLSSLFSGYFVEGRSSGYQLHISGSAESLAQFSHFLVQCRRIRMELKERMKEYFFNHDPGAVTLEYFGATSVATLTESIRVLADVTVDHVGR